MKRTLLSLICVGSVGCATSDKIMEAEYNRLPGDTLPATAIFYQEPSFEFERECAEFDQQSLLHHCKINDFDLEKFYIELANTGLFDGIGYAQESLEFRLTISTANFNHEGGEDLGNALLSGATLFLIPLKTSMTTKVEADLFWNGELLKRYHYEIPYEIKESLFTMDQDTESDIARSVVSHLVKDFQEDKIYSQQYLHNHLGSADYDTDLRLPDEVGNFLKSESYQYHNPLLGIQTRFTHQNFQFDYIDTFIYPIVHWQYSDKTRILERESKSIRRDMDDLRKAGEWKELIVSEDVVEHWDIHGEHAPVLSFTATFTDDQDTPYQTHTYLLVKEDKIVKLRATFAQAGQSPDSVGSFAKRFYPEVIVPKESVFMERIRKQWRKSSFVAE